MWGTTTDTNASKLTLSQKKMVLCIAADAPYDAHTAPIFRSLSIAPAHDLYQLQSLRRCRTCRGNNNTFLNTIAKLSLNNKNYPTRNNDIWSVPFCRTNYGLQMLRYQLPQLLNTQGELKKNIDNEFHVHNRFFSLFHFFLLFFFLTLFCLRKRTHELIFADCSFCIN